MSRFIVYGLFDPRSNSIRYVGASTVGLVRPRTHWTKGTLRPSPGRRTDWVRELLSLGLLPRVEVLQEFPTVVGLARAEQWWIALLRELGAELTNETEGGEGIPGAEHGPEHWEALKERRREGRERQLDERLTLLDRPPRKGEYVIYDQDGNWWRDEISCAQGLGVKPRVVERVFLGRQSHVLGRRLTRAPFQG